MKLNRSFTALLLILSSISMTACEGLWKTKSEQRAVQKEIKEKGDFYPEAPAALWVNQPTIKPSNVVTIKRDPLWTQAQVPSTSGTLKLHALMKIILNGASVNVAYADKEANVDVSVRVAGTIKEALETISSATGLSYEIGPNSIKWSEYVTETFPVAYIPGKYSYTIGSTAGGNDKDGGSSRAVKFGSDGNQFSNVTGSGEDAFDEMNNVLHSIVEDYGQINISRTTSSVIVSTTKSRMLRVKEYMTKVERSLGRQVAFEIKILRFTSNDQGQAGIDWNTVEQRANGVLKFQGGDLNGLEAGRSGSPVTFSTTKTVGKLAGSDLLLQVLQEQGQVTVVNQPKIVTQVNRVAELELSNLRGYIAQTSVTNNVGSGSASTNPSVSLTPGVVESGYTIYAMANISGDDKIILHMSSVYTDLIGITRKEVSTSAIESPEMSRNKMVNTTVLRNGSTMIIGGLQLQSDRQDTASPLSPTVLPTRNSHKRQLTETIALVTPVIVDMN